MFIIPIYLFSEIFPVWKTYLFAHLFFLHQGPFTSLAATDDFNPDGILLHNLVRSGSPGVWLTLNSIRLFYQSAVGELEIVQFCSARKYRSFNLSGIFQRPNYPASYGKRWELNPSKLNVRFPSPVYGLGAIAGTQAWRWAGAVLG